VDALDKNVKLSFVLRVSEVFLEVVEKLTQFSVVVFGE
jgi:hypothetical protein